MKISRYKFVIAFAVVVLSGAFMLMHSSQAFACGSGPAIAYGRNQFCGYVDNTEDDTGGACSSGFVLCGGYDAGVNSAGSLISFLKKEVGGADGTQNSTGAAFIVHTMLGDKGGAVGRGVSGTDWTDIAARVDSYSSYGSSGSGSNFHSDGPSGSVYWFSSENINCGLPANRLVDTYYQAPENDDAFYQLTLGSTPSCNDGTQIMIEFFNTKGVMVYQSRRICGNPIGDSGGLTKAVYNLLPGVAKSVSSGKTVAVPGDTIKFVFDVNNTGDGDSAKTTCDEYQNLYAGNHPTPGGPGFDKGGTHVTDCSGRIFDAGTDPNIKTDTVLVTLAMVNHTVCRTLYVNPATPASISRGAEACVYVSTYALIPTVNDTSSGGNNAYAEVGDVLTFVYTVTNTAAGPSHDADCQEYDTGWSGYHAAPAPPAYDTAGSISTANKTLCTAKSFAGGVSVKLKTETFTVTAAMVNTTICRTLTVAPSSPTVAILGAEDCVPIVIMPYTRVFGGDVSAGNAQSSATCTPANDWDSGVAGWNLATGFYNGAGTQLAAFAIGEIADFATSQTNSAATNGVAPSGIAFANTTAGGGGVYGGSLGASSLPCMNNYYVVPTGATNIPTSPIDVSTLASGAYVYTGATTLNLYGVVPLGHRIQLFVPNHNVYITKDPANHDFEYASGWTNVSDIPMFELVVNKANIYVDVGVSRLDGTFIAQNSQANGLGTGGQIATCATAAGPTATINFYSQCDNNLDINGAFVADEVILGRSPNWHTLEDSSSDDPNSLSSAAAEQFVYNPSLWLVQPPSSPGALTYNTVVDLPPVL